MHSSIYWKAVYNDGTELPQFEEDGTENKYPDIDRSKLATFEIRKAAITNNEVDSLGFRKYSEQDKLLFKMYMQPGRRLICRRRVMDHYKIGGKSKDPTVKRYWQEVVYLVGWQATIGGRSVQDIAYVFEDGHVELAGKWMNAPYDAPGNPMPCETKCYDEHHFSVSAVIVKREKKTAGMDAILVKKETDTEVDNNV